MTIDLFTVLAQLINFLILLFLLRRFLFTPVIRIMEERQAHISSQLEEAEATKQAAKLALQGYQQQEAELANQRDRLIEQARQEADKTKTSLLKQAKAELEGQREQWYQALDSEKTSFLQALQKRSSREFYKSMHRALADLADLELEAQITEVFIRRLQNLDGAQRSSLQEALKQASGNACLLSSYPLAAESRSKLETVLKSVLDSKLELSYQQNAELICGLELTLLDKKLSWSLASYLDALEASLNEQLTTEAQAKVGGL
ncbi:MAG: F0F1 ATP synthase subunit delta [Trueperaceae bacterium]|nr:F0F1 ATP synthase subunit delta [Trueperaceae bacterium]